MRMLVTGKEISYVYLNYTVKSREVVLGKASKYKKGVQGGWYGGDYREGLDKSDLLNFTL